jgi:hypothetical protein
LTGPLLAAHARALITERSIMRAVLLLAVTVLVSSPIAGCTEGDRAAMFSTARPPKVGRCDPQPGYPPPDQIPGCEAAQGTSGGSNRR